MNTTQITASSIKARKLEEDRVWGIATIELLNRATLPTVGNGLVTKIGMRTTTYISLGEFSRLVFLGDKNAQHKKGLDALLQLKERIHAENLNPDPKEIKSTKKAINAKFQVEVKFEPFDMSVLDIGSFRRLLISAKACEMMIEKLDQTQTNPKGPEELLAYFNRAHTIASRYFGSQETVDDCVLGISPDGHKNLELREKPSYVKTDPAYFVKQCRDSQNEWHETYMTTIGLAQLIFRNGLQENCTAISDVLHKIDANLKSLGRVGSKQWSFNTSIGAKQLHLISRTDFIHMCDRLKWEEQYRLPACDWEIREDGLAGFRAATIAWHEAQNALKRNSDVGASEKLEAESLAAVAADVGDPFDFKFEGSNDDRAQSQKEISETLNPSAAPTGAVDPAPQPPAPQPTEMTIHQKLQEIADRANAKKREIDEAMNLEMVALFSSEQAAARNARKLGIPESSPTTGAMMGGFS